MALIGNVLTLRLADELEASRVSISNLRNVSFSYINEMIEATKGRTNRFREFVPGMREFSISFEANLEWTEDDSIGTIRDLLARELFFVFFGGQNNFMQADAYFNNINITGSANDRADLQASITITGEVIEEIAYTTDFLLDSNYDIITDREGEAIFTLNIDNTNG